jgi:NADPH:quinone reductase-like Zn-dependent oxidoreductase
MMSNNMKAIIFTKYGPPEVLQLREVEKPTPKNKEVLIKLHASSVCFGDLMARNFQAITPRSFNMPYLIWLLAKLSLGFRKPNVAILGSEFAGEIDAVGKGVSKFKVGDSVFGYRGEKFGAYAQYLCMPENAVLTAKPSNMSYAESAVLPYGSIIAINLLGKKLIKPGQKVLILGASGSIGSAGVQIAKHFGAEVTGVCSTKGLEFVKSLGADKVMDYTVDDFTKNGEKYDLIFDVLGRSSFENCRNSLNPDGTLLYASFKIKQLAQMLKTSRSKSQKVICGMAPASLLDLNSVKELIEQGSIKAIIDKEFPLEQTAEAHRYVEAGLKKGNVAITVD